MKQEKFTIVVSKIIDRFEAPSFLNTNPNKLTDKQLDVFTKVSSVNLFIKKIMETDNVTPNDAVKLLMGLLVELENKSKNTKYDYQNVLGKTLFKFVPDALDSVFTVNRPTKIDYQNLNETEIKEAYEVIIFTMNLIYSITNDKGNDAYNDFLASLGEELNEELFNEYDEELSEDDDEIEFDNTVLLESIEKFIVETDYFDLTLKECIDLLDKDCFYEDLSIEDIAIDKLESFKDLLNSFEEDEVQDVLEFYENLLENENTSEFSCEYDDILAFTVFIYKDKKVLKYFIPNDVKKIINDFIENN